MNRRSVITMTVLGLALLPGSAVSQQQSHACLLPACESLKQQLVGTWTLVSYERVFPDGRKLHLMGANPKGINIFEPNGHYVRILARSDLPRFASGDHMKATPEEAKAMVEGMVASYG